MGKEGEMMARIRENFNNMEIQLIDLALLLESYPKIKVRYLEVVEVLEN